MNSETLKALQESILAWEKKLELAESGDYRLIKIGWTSCPLCRLSYVKSTTLMIDDYCVECPIADDTGKVCVGTPYSIVLRELRRLPDIDHEYLIAAITGEINYLKSLLP